MFGHQTMVDGVWSSNISRLFRPLRFSLVLQTSLVHPSKIADIRMNAEHGPILMICLNPSTFSLLYILKKFGFAYSAWINDKCLATKHRQTLFGDQTC